MENFAIFDFELSPDEMTEIAALGAARWPGGRLSPFPDRRTGTDVSARRIGRPRIVALALATFACGDERGRSGVGRARAQVQDGAPAPAAAAAPQPASQPLSEAAQFVAGIQSGRVDVPRVELAARLKAAGFQDTDEFRHDARTGRARTRRPSRRGRQRQRGRTQAGRCGDCPPGRDAGGGIAAAAVRSDSPSCPAGRRYPGLNIVYLHPARSAGRCQQVAAHHRAPDRGPGRRGALVGDGAVRQSHQAGRHALGRDRRHGLLGDRRERDPDPRRRRQPQRQQVHRQLQDPSQV